jgi:predicted XRE-type DNA-binding protein
VKRAVLRRVIAVSDFLNRKITKFSLEKLLRYTDRLGIETTVRIEEHTERQLISA